MYANVYKIGYNLLQTVYPILGLSDAGITANSNLQSLVALNTLPWPRTELIELEEETVVARGAGHLLSVSSFKPSAAEPAVTIHEMSPGVFRLQNSHFTVTIESGLITSLYDRKAHREILSGPANQYAIFDDKPLYWQAWDVEIYHLETRKVVLQGASQILENKPYRVSVVTETKISELSSIRTVISLAACFDDTPSYVEVTADIDWHETHKFLKVEFPVDIRSSEASYETQYGITKRPTHYNTS